MKYEIIILTIIFILGAYFVLTHSTDKIYENFTLMGKNSNQCPDILIQKANEFYLYNSKVKEVPGVNPIKFENLEDYTEFLQWQRSLGIICPVLFLQHSFDAQGKEVYKIRPSPTDLQGGLSPSLGMSTRIQRHVTKLMDASRDDSPYNINSYPGYDTSNMYQGEYTPLDLMDFIEQSTGKSANPMSTNWGGPEFTQQLIDAGYYNNYNVRIKVP